MPTKGKTTVDPIADFREMIIYTAMDKLYVAIPPIRHLDIDKLSEADRLEYFQMIWEIGFMFAFPRGEPRNKRERAETEKNHDLLMRLCEFVYRHLKAQHTL